MNVLEKIDVAGVDIKDVLKNIKNYLDNPEIISACLDVLSTMLKQVKEAKMLLEGNIIKKMESDNATKLNFIDTSGNSKNIVLSVQPPKCNLKSTGIEKKIKANGFDPCQLGQYEYKLMNWSVAKELRKQGGEIQILIDDLYVKSDKKSLKIK